METLKQEAFNEISKLPDMADIDDILYLLYVIDEVKKGKEAIEQGKVISVEELKRELNSW